MNSLPINSVRWIALPVLLLLVSAACGEDDAGSPRGSSGGSGPTGEGAGGEGPTALVELTSIDPGNDCSAGGLLIETGVDLDGDGVLAADEVTESEIVCNGPDGEDGTDGTNGEDGTDGTNGEDGTDGTSSLVEISPEPPGVNCGAGGQRVDIGLDNGDGGGTASDGNLQAGEIDETSYVCVECTDSDGDEVCDSDDSCPRNARIAAWFPGDTGSAAVTAFAEDLENADNVTSVAVLDSTSDPSLGELLTGYDAVIVASNWGFGGVNADAIGNLLADYVDAGGLVVDAMFNHTNWTDGTSQEWLGGRWQADGYNAVVNAPQVDAPTPDVTMTVTAPTDPLMDGFTAAAFLADMSATQGMYLTSGTLNEASPLGFVELARFVYTSQNFPAILVSKHRDKRVLALGISPIFNFATDNTDSTTRDWLACSISQLVR